MPKKSLGESLVEEKLLSQEQLWKAQQEEQRTGLRLRKVLVKLGLIDEEDLVNFLSTNWAIPKIDPSNYLIDPKLIDLVPEELAKKHEMIPVLKIANRLTCAMVDPLNVFALDEVRMKTNYVIEPAVAPEASIKKAIDEHYGAKGSLDELIRNIDKEKFSVKEGKDFDVKKLEGISKEPVVIKLVNLMVMEALKMRASDIHIEPEENALKTRFRIDGIMQEVASPPKHLQAGIISRIKIMSNLDIAERRIPQDGRFNLKADGKEVDVRVSCMPTIYGENVVMRLLDVSSAFRGLDQLGFGDLHALWEKLLSRAYGIILVTGPTGSGKTTTLYASLAKLNTSDKNIITIEDPVEYRLSGIRQTQINPKVGLTFATGLRSILRQDPDIIMVGEIRDQETVAVAIQAALTGHLVLSTLHTNDAPSAVTRLNDMGVEPFLIASSVIGVLAQRLVRGICKECKESYTPSDEALRDIGVKTGGDIKFYRGKGCGACMQTGYKGRLGIYELMAPNEEIHRLILARAPFGEIRKAARNAGMLGLKEDGVRKITMGITTVEEVLRIILDE